MQFEWDEAKRLSNVAKHGLDFRDADLVFGGEVHEQPSRRLGEERVVAVGLLDERFVTIVYTRRGDIYRIISMRRSRDAEKRKYRALYGR